MHRIGVAVDVVAVLAFVGIGRAVHAHDVNIGGMASTTWPFLTGLAIGWVVLVLCSLSPISPAGGLTVTAATVTVGMVLRVVAGQGTAFAFVLVALGFLGAAMVGWRLIVGGIRHQRATG